MFGFIKKMFVVTISFFSCNALNAVSLNVCDKFCDAGEYLDHKNGKCRKRLIDKLVEEYSKNTDCNRTIYNDTLNDYGKICDSCTIYIELLAIFVIASLSISSVFIYFDWYLKRRYTETTIY